MRNQDYNCAAALDLDSLDVAVRRNAGSPIDGRSEFNMQKPFRQESACLTVQQSAFFSGFFTSVAAALQAIHSAQVGGVEPTDERNHSGASRGRGYSPRYAGRESKKEATCKFTGFAIRAVRGFRIIRSRIKAAMMEQENGLVTVGLPLNLCYGLAVCKGSDK